MIPLPTGFFGGSIFVPPLLDRISAGTTVIFAGSVARQLKAAATFAYTAAQKGSGSSLAKIEFLANGLADTATLTALAAGQTSGQQSTALSILNDQTGNANYMGRPTFSHYCPLTTPAGALNAPTAVAGGTEMPTFSTGYNGLQSANSGPYLTSGSWNGVTNTGLTQGVMSVPFGAVKTFWAYDVVRLNSSATTTAGGGIGEGLLLNITADGGSITASALASGGIHYAEGDTGTVNGGSGDASYSVDTVNAFGSVTGYHLTGSGTAYFTETPGNASGRIASYTNTGDSTDSQTTTSAALMLRAGLNIGSVQAMADGAGLSVGNLANQTLGLVGSIFDGTHNTIRINGTAQAKVNYSATLGSGGEYALGEIADVGPFGSAPLAADRIEHLCGTTIVAADIALIEANLMAFYGIAA